MITTSKNNDSIQALVSANRKYVASVASMYNDRGRTQEELVEAGTRGLETAAEKFRPDQGFSFISYAVWYIRQAIEDSLDGAADGQK